MHFFLLGFVTVAEAVISLVSVLEKFMALLVVCKPFEPNKKCIQYREGKNYYLIFKGPSIQRNLGELFTLRVWFK